jgi:hypothetical protein
MYEERHPEYSNTIYQYFESDLAGMDTISKLFGDLRFSLTVTTLNY